MYGQNKNAKKKNGMKKKKATAKKNKKAPSFLDRIKGRNTSKKKKVRSVKGY